MLFDVAKTTSNNVTAAVEKGANAPETGSATITDFNPNEDVIFIPLPSDGDIYIDENSSGTNLFKVFQDTDKTDVIATVQLSNDFNNLEGYSNGKLQSSWFDILERNALILDSSDAKDYKSNTLLDIEQSDIENLGTNKFLVLGAYSGLDIKGSNNADYSYGTQFGDVLYGYEESALANTAGNDVMYGFEGDDQFLGGQGNDRIYGGDGSDTANYTDSTSGININLENGENNDDGFGTKDTLNSIENIFGSKHNDTITGDDNDNVLASAQGNDILTGNSGDDTFILSSGDNTITDFNPAEDKIQIDIQDYYDASNNQVRFDVSHSNDTLTISVSASDQDIILEHIASSEVGDVLKKIEFIGTEELQGTGSKDILIGNDCNNDIDAGHGNDYVYGGGGNDTLHGKKGQDVLIGGDGNDDLQGYKDNDTLIGGAGSDKFIFRHAARTSGIDTILDFSDSEGDLIRIDKSHYGISGLGAVSFDNSTNELLVNNSVIAILENQSGFSVESHVSLF
ncbi:calcium-binding protein [Dapis sp. BLCC M229]|uniref:calcium-binding protein n=1 Tax=Dapis sp. BLCC M229 TaxID=3400188 RepID=UPI003CF608B8